MIKMAKLITENSDQVEITETKNKNLYITGIFSSAEIKNENGRKYKYDILKREVEKLIEQKVKQKRAFGELNHPTDSSINAERIAIIVEEMEFKGHDIYGRAKIIEDLPMGKIAAALVRNSGKIGISSRGLGTVNEDGYVNEDFNLITYDVVLDPSNPGSWVNGIYEGKEFPLHSNKTYSKEELSKIYVNEMTKKLRELL